MFALLKAAAIAAAITVVATPASAATAVRLTSAGIYTPGTVDYNRDATAPMQSSFASVLKFTADRGNGVSFDLLGFCIDLFHPIGAGIDSQAPISLNYSRAAFLTDNNGTSLSFAQQRQIGGLAEIGFAIARGNGVDRAARLAAIQQAIWTIEYPAISFVAGNTLPGQQAFTDAYVAQAPSLSGVARVIYADDNATQGFIISGVPEPTTWAMLIVGFGMAGVAARRRRALVQVVA